VFISDFASEPLIDNKANVTDAEKKKYAAQAKPTPAKNCNFSIWSPFKQGEMSYVGM